jgi:hypothetical protein
MVCAHEYTHIFKHVSLLMDVQTFLCQWVIQVFITGSQLSFTGSINTPGQWSLVVLVILVENGTLDVQSMY